MTIETISVRSDAYKYSMISQRNPVMRCLRIMGTRFLKTSSTGSRCNDQIVMNKSFSIKISKKDKSLIERQTPSTRTLSIAKEKKSNRTPLLFLKSSMKTNCYQIRRSKKRCLIIKIVNNDKSTSSKPKYKTLYSIIPPSGVYFPSAITIPSKNLRTPERPIWP